MQYDVQIIGATGMLGTSVARTARERGLRVYDERLDLEVCTVRHLRAPIIINCAGLVKQTLAIPSDFMKINGWAPQRLAEMCSLTDTRLVQVSTDCVFERPEVSGLPHSEEDAPTPHDAYARSKLAGEVYYSPHLTVRTSFVGFGRYGLIRQLMTAPVVASPEMLWTGHTADTVASILLDLAQLPISGILHIPGEIQTRLELCERLVKVLDLPTSRVIPSPGYVMHRALRSVRWDSIGLPPPPPFDVQLANMRLL